jgi:(2Fe-2S) ferredoxin
MSKIVRFSPTRFVTLINNMNQSKRCIIVCQHSSCKAFGSAKVLFTFQVANLPFDVAVIATGCQGQCGNGPIVRILPDDTWYCRVTPLDVPIIVEQHLNGGKWVQEKLHPKMNHHRI